jgi:TOMM system kinase/cyclase fusion protein
MNRTAPLLSPGTRFENRYEILSLLGQGGFGVVYQARQLTTGQVVAIKLMREVEHPSPARLEKRAARFLREMQLCAQLQHPHIVQLIDAGRDQHGGLYTVFAFVPGENLRDLLAREGALPPSEARRLMLQVLDALSCAHSAGVVHRDLKPSNIMILSTGARRNAVVLDFGLGALTLPPDPDLPRLTDTNDMLGTPGYAAPEQLRGVEASPSADLFAWGIIYAECLRGSPIYQGASTPEVLYAQLSPAPVPLGFENDTSPLASLLRQATHKDESLRLRDAALAFSLLENLAPGPSSGASALHAHPDAPTLAGQVLPLGEWRHLTALCYSLDPLSSPDAEEAEERARAQLNACIAEIQAARGHVVAGLGLQLLAYFGYPQAEEDDARRAARLSLRLTQTSPERPRPARLGLHSGVVLTGAPGSLGLGVGTSAAHASRLSLSAPPGETHLSAETAQLLRAHFAIEETSEARILLRERDSADLEQTPSQSRAPLIGREGEFEMLRERWERARRGAGQSALLTGEPGIGKSRLARELRASLAGTPHTAYTVRCSPDAQHSALFPIKGWLSQALEQHHAKGSAEQLAQVESQLRERGLSPASLLPFVGPLLGLASEARYPAPDVSPQRMKELTLDAILSFLFAFAEERPLLLVVEDLHWADASTLALLGQVVREAPSAGVFLLMTARPEFVPPFSTLGVQQLHLGRLDREQIDTLAERLAGKPLPQEAREQIARRTDGVPLFVEELVRMLVSAGVLQEKEDRYEVQGTLLAATIPNTLRELLGAHLDRLGRAKETAQLAAAVGREVSLALLGALSPFGADAAQEDVERLVAADLMHHKRRRGETSCVFKHALIRDAAYESLPRAARRKVHTHIAEVLERRFPEIAKSRPELLAQHHAAAEQKPRAIEYALRAAQSALVRSDNLEAQGHARAALLWLDGIDEPRARAEAELNINGALTMAVMSTQGYGSAEVAAIVRRSQELLDLLGETPHTIPTLWALFMYHHIQNHRAQARGLAERLLSIAQRDGNKSQEVATWPILGQCFYIEGKLAQSQEALERASALYDPSQHRDHAFMYGLDSRGYADLTLGLVLWLRGFPEQALARGQAAVAWARELNHATTLGLSLLYLTGIHHYQGEREQVIAVTDQLMEIVERHGLAMIRSFGGILRGWAKNDGAAALASLNELRASGQEIGLSYWLSLVAEAEAQGGNLSGALALIDECLHYAEKNEERYYLPELYNFRGDWLAESGQAEAAEESYRRALSLSDALGTKLAALRAALALSRSHVSRGQPASAAALLRPAYHALSEGHALPLVKEARALLEALAVTVSA